MEINFIGAAQTVTGSKSLLTVDGKTLLIDCGSFQGNQKLKKLNLKAPPFPCQNIDYIFLTHGHFDHCGMLANYFKQGFRGKVFCTTLTAKIVKIILEDSLSIQEFEYRRHEIKERSFEQADIEGVLQLVEEKEFDTEYKLNNLTFEFKQAGHILGASNIIISTNSIKTCFSGDMGRDSDLIHKKYQLSEKIDYLVLESTYGNRVHKKSDYLKDLKQYLSYVIDQKSILLIPCFAIARTQILIYMLKKLFENYPELEIPVYLDSPMGIKVTYLYEKNVKELKVAETEFLEAIKTAKKIEFGKDLKKLENNKGPHILISSSGMITGGKVVKHFDRVARNENNMILLTGFQGEGTIGRDLLEGKKEFVISKNKLVVRAKVEKLEGLSAHGDSLEMINKIRPATKYLEKIFLNHGEAESQIEFKKLIEKELGINVEIAAQNKSYCLGE